MESGTKATESVDGVDGRADSRNNCRGEAYFAALWIVGIVVLVCLTAWSSTKGIGAPELQSARVPYPGPITATPDADAYPGLTPEEIRTKTPAGGAVWTSPEPEILSPIGTFTPTPSPSLALPTASATPSPSPTASGTPTPSLHTPTSTPRGTVGATPSRPPVPITVTRPVPTVPSGSAIPIPSPLPTATHGTVVWRIPTQLLRAAGGLLVPRGWTDSALSDARRDRENLASDIAGLRERIGDLEEEHASTRELARQIAHDTDDWGARICADLLVDMFAQLHGNSSASTPWYEQGLGGCLHSDWSSESGASYASCLSDLENSLRRSSGDYSQASRSLSNGALQLDGEQYAALMGQIIRMASAVEGIGSDIGRTADSVDELRHAYESIEASSARIELGVGILTVIATIVAGSKLLDFLVFDRMKEHRNRTRRDR